ncbi:contact-dependent growth inhibition system immunity protein [Bosea sp. BK604]|uniref:contact-dependent growth inhibition system immunity protein n=1 Tax=Bosea sp. BK604 TaxID=2512180 RepID=UPI00104B17BF|nr:contact-dependent growth inhibition system immunity protein [Bosea sp. BK604]TCR65675.1 hypothetical protein EV560_105438 [Bosea sp. BK604]
MAPKRMAYERANLSLTLEQLTGHRVGDPKDAPTGMIRTIYEAYKKPLDQLSDWDIRLLVSQYQGYPYVLDLVWPKLEADPLFDGGLYPGDVLVSLVRAEDDMWAERPDYRARLQALCD